MSSLRHARVRHPRPATLSPPAPLPAGGRPILLARVGRAQQLVKPERYDDFATALLTLVHRGLTTQLSNSNGPGEQVRGGAWCALACQACLSLSLEVQGWVASLFGRWCVGACPVGPVQRGPQAGRGLQPGRPRPFRIHVVGCCTLTALLRLPPPPLPRWWWCWTAGAAAA